jgi:hypothetical protein
MTLVHDDIDLEDPSGSTRHASRRRRWVAAVTGAAAVLAAMLIATTAPARDGTPTGTQPPTAPSTVPAVAVTTPPAAPERLSESSRLRLDGIGPVVVGMTLDEASAAAGMPVRMIPNSNLAGAGRCAYARPEGGPEGLSFMTLDGRIVRVDVVNSRIRTLPGVGTGSTESELQATYPGRLRVEPNPYTGHLGGRDIVYVADEASAHLSLLFQADGGRVTSFRSGLLGAVMAPEGCS